ncbi:YcgL domain-containing protein [Methylomicrobium sp. Wu6]|uniref:YcgL domain-containing protein n=1 Tax=Methylomicrobium sp. Wu6 TaxID=3107928 RepID=UPI002DD6B800|nr:YcgL domain-containing protein [Methylomicrobium sp. Wu6]MEC4747395.1 YcgL domain-containing protein [Methylomicrobium sp. Wu6]
MQCFIYKSSKKQDVYLYLKDQDDFTCLPQALQNSLGRMEFVFSLEITPERKLANADPVSVLNNLSKQGYFLQLPPVWSAPATLQ